MLGASAPALALIASGLLVTLVGVIPLILRAFRRSRRWGLAAMFLPFAIVVFAARRWRRCRTDALVALMGIAVACAGGGLLLLEARSADETDDPVALVRSVDTLRPADVLSGPPAASVAAPIVSGGIAVSAWAQSGVLSADGRFHDAVALRELAAPQQGSQGTQIHIRLRGGAAVQALAVGELTLSDLDDGLTLVGAYLAASSRVDAPDLVGVDYSERSPPQGEYTQPANGVAIRVLLEGTKQDRIAVLAGSVTIATVDLEQLVVVAVASTKRGVELRDPVRGRNLTAKLEQRGDSSQVAIFASGEPVPLVDSTKRGWASQWQRSPDAVLLRILGADGRARSSRVGPRGIQVDADDLSLGRLEIMFGFRRVPVVLSLTNIALASDSHGG